MFSDALHDLTRPHVLGVIRAIKTSNGLSIPELAEELGLSYMGVKKHCVKLESLGYLKTWRLPNAGVGRPQKLYLLTQKCDELFPEAGAEIVMSLLQGVKQLFGESSAEKLFFHHFQQQREQWSTQINKGNSLVEKATHLADLRDKAGCFSRCKYDKKNGFRIEEYHHPLKKLFAHYPSLIAMEIRMMEQLLGTHVHRKEAVLTKAGKIVIYQIGTLA